MSQLSGLQEETATASWVREQLIFLHRLNGQEIGVNSDLIERAEATPDTVLTLVDGTKYVVAESIREVADRLVMNQAYALAIAYDLVEGRDRGQANLRALP